MKIRSIISWLILLIILTSCSDSTIIENQDIQNKVTDEQIKQAKEELIWASITKPVLLNIPLEDFKQELLKDTPIVLDLRTTEELEDTWIINWAQQIDFYSTDFRSKLDNLDKNKKYLIYCRSGNRSWQTLKLMKQMGFVNVYELKWWMNNWLQSGEKIVKINE